MSQISEIANHFLSPRNRSGPQRIALIGGGGRDGTLNAAAPVSLLAANLALKCAMERKRVFAIEGEEEKTDMGSLFLGAPLPLLEETGQDAPWTSPRPGIDLFRYCLTPDRGRLMKPSQWERLKRREEEADLLLVTLPGDATLFLWEPMIRSLHAVVLQTAVREKDQGACYRILRFLYARNPFLRVHLVTLPLAGEGAPGEVYFYERLSSLVAHFLRQSMIGPYPLIIKNDPSHPLINRTHPQTLPDPRLTPLLERLTQGLLTHGPLMDRPRFSGFFASFESTFPQSPDSNRPGPALFRELDDYHLLDVEVGPKRVALLLNWERRLAVGEIAHEGIGEALVRGVRAMEWVHDHLPLLARLYDGKVDPVLSPHLVLIAQDYPPDFCVGLSRLGLPVALYKTCGGEKKSRVTPVSSPLKSSFAPELSLEEENALKTPISF
ncbi:MAG TPA: hypothetical protein VI382_05675 [Candidatus Manganitrophaceae bacterium]|nr:hypothetical protein [Candidatus Manganitrophaceae bacterium]